MFDLQIMAFRADITRVFSIILARELSGRILREYRRPGQSPPDLAPPQRSGTDVAEGPHRYLSRAVAGYFLEKMQATPDGDGSLLDHSLILYGSGMGDGNLHRHSDLPVPAGRKAGRQVRDRLSSRLQG